jgi:hypothetical protein
MDLTMMERVGDRWEKMEGSCSTGQSPPWAVVPVEEEEEEPFIYNKNIQQNLCHHMVYFKPQTNFHSDVFRHPLLPSSGISVEFWKLTELPEDGKIRCRNLSQWKLVRDLMYTIQCTTDCFDKYCH